SEIRISNIKKKDQYLEIQVEDTGTGKNKIKAVDMEKLFQDKKAPGYTFMGIRGRGLVKIVGEWTDELKFEDRPEGGIRVTVKKYLKDPRFKSGLPETIENQLVINN
ncbi:ATP-binding protein, partial [Candidatus Peregrinibacteria bacterium]|nr:ATP-binding protein [Candidatus Peregrinibacteria bacterium]